MPPFACPNLIESSHFHIAVWIDRHFGITQHFLLIRDRCIDSECLHSSPSPLLIAMSSPPAADEWPMLWAQLVSHVSARFCPEKVAVSTEVPIKVEVKLENLDENADLPFEGNLFESSPPALPPPEDKFFTLPPEDSAPALENVLYTGIPAAPQIGYGKYVCDTCSRRFVHVASLNRHRLNFHSNCHACTLCDARIDGRSREPGRETIRTHMASHGYERIFTCGCCNWIFPDKKALRSHNLSMEASNSPGNAQVIAKTMSPDGIEPLVGIYKGPARRDVTNSSSPTSPKTIGMRRGRAVAAVPSPPARALRGSRNEAEVPALPLHPSSPTATVVPFLPPVEQPAVDEDDVPLWQRAEFMAAMAALMGGEETNDGEILQIPLTAPSLEGSASPLPLTTATSDGEDEKGPVSMVGEDTATSAEAVTSSTKAVTSSPKAVTSPAMLTLERTTITSEPIDDPQVRQQLSKEWAMYMKAEQVNEDGVKKAKRPRRAASDTGIK